MKRSELVKEVSKSTGVDRETVNKVMTATNETIQVMLLRGIDVKMDSFANFKLEIRNASRKFNPLTKEFFDVPKKYYIKTIWSRPFMAKLKNKTVY